MSATAIQFRYPSVNDAIRMHELVRDSESLDLNSLYVYLLLSTTFSDTTVVAELDSRLVGFVAGFIPPRQADTVFVWQVGVAKEARGRGLAKQLLHELVARPVCAPVTAMEATVTPGNEASAALFRSFARSHSADVEVRKGRFDASAFGDTGHEPEDLFRIEPISSHAAGKAAQTSGA